MSAFSQAVNHTGKKPKAEGRPQIGRNQAYSTYSPPASQGQAQSSYGSRQQQGGFPEVPQKGQQSAPDMSAYRQQSGFRYSPSPPPGMGTVAPPPAEGPVAVQDPSGVQRQIDRLKQMGTWDDPRNAEARERLEAELRNVNAAPPGYFITPDGRVEPNYIATLHSPAPQAAAPQSPPRAVGGGYGARIGLPPNAMVTSDFKDGDRDGVDDRYQPGPGQQQATNYMPQQPFSMPPMDFGTRDAFIASINNSLAQQQANGFNTQGAVPPQFNFPALYQQAQQMTANGWSNPLAGLFR